MKQDFINYRVEKSKGIPTDQFKSVGSKIAVSDLAYWVYPKPSDESSLNEKTLALS